MENKSTFKNQEDFDKYSISNCPPKDAIELTIPAYRYVRNPISSDDFQNHIKLGLVPRQTEDIHSKCSRCGLSMFKSESTAKKRYDSLPNKSVFTYTHIAMGKLEPKDGVCTKIDNKGHFTLHEYHDSDISQNFKIISSLN